MKFFDFAVIHVLTTATIDRLRELYPEGRFEVRRFRPNIVVEPASGEKSFVENSWIGRTLTLGDEIRLSISGPCPRWVVKLYDMLPADAGDTSEDRTAVDNASVLGVQHQGHAHLWPAPLPP